MIILYLIYNENKIIMPKYLTAYTGGATISGFTNIGNIAIDTNPGSGNYSLGNFVGGISDSYDTNGYVIITDTTTAGVVGRPTGNNTGTSTANTPTFWVSPTKDDSGFLLLVNRLPARSGQTPFTMSSVATTWLNSNGYWTSYLVTSTLGTIGNPAVNAQAIYNSGQTTDGWYYIKTSNMTSARQIYCNMTDQGGGWMLMTYNPNVNTSAGTPYPNQWLGGTGSFTSIVSIDTRQVWYDSGSAQCTQVMKMATSATASLTPLLANMQIANKVVYTNPNNLKLTATFSTSSNAVTVNDTPMSGTWSGVKGHTLMTGNLNVNAPGDWVYLANQPWWTVCGPSTAYPDSNGRSGNAQGSGSWTNIGTNNIYGMSDVSAVTTSQRTDIKTYAVYIK